MKHDKGESCGFTFISIIRQMQKGNSSTFWEIRVLAFLLGDRRLTGRSPFLMKLQPAASWAWLYDCNLHQSTLQFGDLPRCLHRRPQFYDDFPALFFCVMTLKFRYCFSQWSPFLFISKSFDSPGLCRVDLT